MPARSLIVMHAMLLVLDKISSILVGGAIAVASLCVAGIIGVNTVDTVGRAFFNSPMLGAVEITEVLLAACIVLAIPYAQRFGEHIEIDILRKTFGLRLAQASAVLVLVLTNCVFSLLALQSYESALTSVVNFEVSAGYVRVPVWLGKLALFVGFSIALFEALRQLLDRLFGGGGKPRTQPTASA